MRPLLALLLIAVLAMVGWVMLAVMPASSTGEGQLELRPGLVDESVVLPAVEQEEVAVGISREPVQPGRVIEYRLVDAETGEGLAGAGIYKVKTGELVMRCNEDGVAQSTEPDPGQLYYYAEGYLLGFFLMDYRRLAEMRAGAGLGLVSVHLHRDVISFPLRVEFRLPDGTEPESLRCEYSLVDASKRIAVFTRELRGKSKELQAAWKMHGLLPSRSSNQVQKTVFVPKGQALPESSSIKLSLSGIYQFSASIVNGYYAKTESWVDAGTRVLTIDLAQGNKIFGQVRDRDSGDPIAGVRVWSTTRSKPNSPLPCLSDEEGRFEFYCSGIEARPLFLSQPFYMRRSFREVLPGSELNLSMKALPLRDFAGRVLTRVSGLPIEGVRLKIWGMVTTTDGDGSFLFEGLPMSEGWRMNAEEDRHHSRSWSVDPKDAEHRFAMTPQTQELRVTKSVSCVLSGRVIAADGRPVANAELRLSMDGEPLPRGVFTNGGSLPVLASEDAYLFDADGWFVAPDQVRADEGGNFTFECGRPGLAKVTAKSEELAFTTVQVELGRKYEDLLIRIK